MLATRAAFDLYNMRGNIASSLIVKITGGSTVFYFSDRIIDLTDSSIKTQGVVIDFGTLSQKIDLFKKVSSISNVKLKLVNAPYSVSTTGTGSVCLSDVLAADNIFNATVEIYFWYEGLTDIADCLKLFDGLTQSMAKVTPENLELNILDNSVFYHRTVPASLVNATDFPNAPRESMGKPLPLAYGNFAMNTENVGGMIEGIWIGEDKIVFSGHALKSISNVWVYDETLEQLVKLESTDYTATPDDSGIGTVVIDDMNATDAHFYHLPNSEILTYDDTYTDYPFSNMNGGHDKNLDTSGQVTRPEWTGGGGFHDVTGSCKYYWNEVVDAGTIVSVSLEIYYHKYDGGRFFNSVIPDFNWSSGQGSIQLSFGNDDQWITDAIPAFDWPDFGSFYAYIANDGTDLHYVIQSGDTETVSFDIQEVRIHIRYTCGIQTGWRIFAECEGREFGSWIDEGGRSNSYNENDLIENPAHIIESILRDELGLSASNVDVASFDSVGGDLSSWDLVVGITSLIRSDRLFAEIGFQSKTHTFFDSQGTAKIGVLDDTGTSSDESFGKDDIKRGKVQVSQGDMKQLINSVDVLWLPEILDPESGYQKNSSDTDSTSITTYGITKHRTLQASYIHDDTVAGNFSDHFTDSTGYWKDLQEILEVTMANWEYIYLEIGDIIDPETSINDVLKLFNDAFGTPANAPLFLITEKKIGKDLKFKMQRMGETGGA